MAPDSLPRYFVARDGGRERARLPADILAPAHVVDCFFAGGGHVVEREWVVTTDVAGHLLPLPGAGRAALPETIRAESAYHEVSGGGRGRLIEVAEFYLFHLQLMEQPSPGLDDPVYLYGELFGPYPAPGGEFSAGVEGQLTVTRADLLDGLVRGAKYPFRYAGTEGDSGPPPRCFHLALPADREDAVSRGGGVVLAYPLLPPELALDDAANEIIVSTLLHDTLSALKEDLSRAGVDHPLRTLTLPVPSRPALERQLQSQGYEVSGDTAVKKTPAGEGFRGLLASVFGSLMAESLELPPEAEVDDFLRIAALALEALPGWPSPRAAALRDRIKPAPPELYRDETPRQPAPPAPETAPRPRRKMPVRAAPAGDGPPAWMQDFIESHRRPGAPEPRLTSTAALPPARRREWMEDFEQNPGPRSGVKPERAGTAGEPTWMKDFK